MPYLVGTDEAGYAPNLGPLVITATVWHVDGDGRADLYRRLRSAVSKAPPPPRSRRIAIADSKLLYRSGAGLAALERSVLAALELTGCCPTCWQEIWRLVDADWSLHLERLPWHLQYDCPLPLEIDLKQLARLRGCLAETLAKAGVRLVAIRSTAVFPERFNDSTLELGSKGEALSKITLHLLAAALEECSGEPVLVVCDKHGGRNTYARLLEEQFPDVAVETCHESGPQSTYCWGEADDRVEVCFRMGGESFLPAALASMTSKYLRELAMRAFNDFWCCRVPDLQPTAGYPGDSKRFKSAIADAQVELGIDDHILWRLR